MSRFTIRDLLWLLVAVLLAVGWWLDRGRTARTVANLKTEAATEAAAAAAAHEKLLAAMQGLRERIASLERERTAASPKDEPSAETSAAETLLPPIAKGVSWDDLALPHDDSFELADLSPLATERRGKRIKIAGHMHGGVASATKNKEFVLLRSKSGRFGPGHPLDELILVSLVPDRTVAYVDDWIQVEGTLRIQPTAEGDGTLWCVYRIDDARVSQWDEVIDVSEPMPQPADP